MRTGSKYENERYNTIEREREGERKPAMRCRSERRRSDFGNFLCSNLMEERLQSHPAPSLCVRVRVRERESFY